MKRSIVGTILLVCACGGGDGAGPTGASQFPSIAGVWFINQAVLSTTCGPVQQLPFVLTITQSGGQIQFAVQGTGAQFVGQLETNGDFSAAQSTLFPALDLRSDSQVSGQFSGGSVSATEDETLSTLSGGGGSCAIRWRWTGNRNN